jgi:hypothetical protein
MARIVLGAYMFRYPLGGMLSWVLQYLLGLKELGHDVIFVEKYGYENSCFDPVRRIMGNDCSYGIRVVSELLSRFGLKEKWCFVEYGERYHGLSRGQVLEIFRSADLFIDMGTHGSWAHEAAASRLRVLIDGEPGYTQMRMASAIEAGKPVLEYDQYFTNGLNVGTYRSPVPTLNLRWQHVFHPVKTALFEPVSLPRDAPLSTIMNWQSHAQITYGGRTYG